MEIILIEDDVSAGDLVTPILEKEFSAKIIRFDSLAGAIEKLDGNPIGAHVLICDYRGKSAALQRCVRDLIPLVPKIFVLAEDQSPEGLRATGDMARVEFVNRRYLTRELKEKISSMQIGTESPSIATQAIQVGQSLDQQISQTPPGQGALDEESKRTLLTSLDVVSALSSRVGFTPQVQAIAQKSVELTLKVLGAKPKLSLIAANLKKQEGKYLGSHSIMLAELSCALACKLEWHSTATFFKLTLAAYLHDLALQDNELAQCRTAKEALAFGDDAIEKFKFHPDRAAAYARKFQEIPPDVDTIIAQHHEMPEGTGFPRGLTGSNIAPLAAVMIVAEDLLHFFLENGQNAKLTDFAEKTKERYVSGTFKKIGKALLLS